MVDLILFCGIGNLVNFRVKYVCSVELWSVLLHMIISFIDIIQHLIRPRLVGVPQYHQEHGWIE